MRRSVVRAASVTRVSGCRPGERVLAGRQALITGASQGLGLAIARAFLAAGASILICGRDPAALERAQAELARLCGPGQELAARPADVADPGEVESLVSAATERFPELSILVNNAGVYGPKGSIWGRRLA